MEEGTIKFEGELEKYSGVGVFKHKIKIWMTLDEFTITLCKFEKRSSCIGSINVYDIQIARKTGHKSGQEFEIKTNTKCFTFIATSNDLATEWVKDIQKSMSKRKTSSSTVIDPDRGRNRRAEANPLPDMPVYDKANKFGVTLKPSSRIINKSASTVSPGPVLDKTKPEFNRSVSVPTEAGKKAVHDSPSSNSADVKLPQTQSVKPFEGVKLKKVPHRVAPPPPCSPVRDEKQFEYAYVTAVDDKDRSDEVKSTAKVIPKEEHDIGKNVEFQNESNSKQNKDNSIDENKPGEHLTTTSDIDKDNNSLPSDAKSNLTEEMSDGSQQVEIRKSQVPEPDGSPDRDNESNSKQNKENKIDENKLDEQQTPTSDIDKDDTSLPSKTESSKTEENPDDTSQVEMRKSQMLETDTSQVIMRKSTKSHISNISHISQTSGSFEADCIYDDIAYAPVYPAQDSSDEGDVDIDNNIVDAFDKVFENRDESEPESEAIYYSYKDEDVDKSCNAFTKLKEYLENNCEFHLETHTVSLFKPIDMLRNHLIK